MKRGEFLAADPAAKPIEGWGKYYEITSDLKVRNKLASTLVSPYPNNLGYMVLTLCVRGYGRKLVSMHRLVAKAFIPNPQNKPCINHINHDRSDYRIENLEWCTPKENSHHMKICGRSSMANIGQTYTNKLTLDLRTGIFYDSLKDAAIARGLNPGSVRAKINIGKFHHELIYV